MHAIAQGVHGIEMFLPEAVDGTEEDIAFEFHGTLIVFRLLL